MLDPAFIDAPVRVPDTTPVCDRVWLLNRIADAGVGSPAVTSIATRILSGSASLPEQEQARDIASQGLQAIQSLPYVPDPAGQEWVQGVGYTLIHGGDCKDTSSALAALYRTMGLSAEVYWITQTGQKLNHVTVRVRVGDRWAWADASIPGARLGESPYEATRRLGANHALRGVQF